MPTKAVPVSADILPIVDSTVTDNKKITIGTLPISTATQAALNTKVTANAAIVAATKTKIAYDAKGLVTSGTDATTGDIADSTDKRYVTDAQLTVISNTSGTNTGDQDLSSLALQSTTISTTAPLTGGGDLSANRTLSIPAATTLVDGYLLATDWTIFNGKQDALGFTPANDALSNLGSTAVNNSINPDTNITHTLGASGLNWLSVATKSILYDDIPNYDVELRKFIDSGSKDSLDYENRFLLDKSGTLVLDWDTCNIDKTRFGLTGISFETVSKNLKQYNYVLNYTSGTLTSIVYTVPSVGTITKTLNYTSGVLTSVVLSGSTPLSIQLTKTLTYTSGALTSIAYT